MRYPYSGTTKDQNGRIIQSATVSVYLAGTSTVASVYAAASGGTAANSVTSDDNGQFTFYIDAADYDNEQLFKIVVSKAVSSVAAYATTTTDNVWVFRSGGVINYYEDALDYGAGDFTQATIEAALTAIGTTNKATLLLRPGTWVISSNADWSAYTNVTFKIVPGAMISHGAFTVNIPNPYAGLYQWLSGTGLVTFSGSINECYPEWFGFATGATAAVNALALQAAINSGAPIVKIPRGTYSYGTALEIDRAIRFDGAGSCNDNGDAGTSTTKLIYTGTGMGINIIGSGVSGKENIHISNFSLWGTAAALSSGIYMGSDVNITKSSIKNVHIRGFVTAGTFGLRIGACLDSIFENVYTQFNYDGIGNTGAHHATTLKFISCRSRVNYRYGWYFNAFLIGSSFYGCFAESNAYDGLYIDSAEFYTNDFYSWYSEANHLTSGAPVTITGGAFSVNFWGGVIADPAASNLHINLDNCDRISFHNTGLASSGAGFIVATASTTGCSFLGAGTSSIDVTGNHSNGVAVYGLDGVVRYSVTLAIDAVDTLTHQDGIYVITDITNNKSGIIALNGSANTVSELSDPDTGFGITVGDAGTVNIYYDAPAYRIQNKTGAEVAVKVKILMNAY